MDNDLYGRGLILEEKILSVDYLIRVIKHEWIGDSYEYYSSHSNLEDAVREWNFGGSRAGAHHWDTTACHVSQNPENGKWYLLYV